MVEYDIGAVVWCLRAKRADPTKKRGGSHKGRAAQAIALDAISCYQPALSAQQHLPGHSMRAYAVSGLMTGDGLPLYPPFHPDMRAWIRLTGLQREVVAAFQEYRPDDILLDDWEWSVEEILWDGNLWAGHTTYAELARRNEKLPASEQITLCFVSPTLFKSNGLSSPLPLPHLVFGSLVNRWREYAPVPLPPEITDFAQHCIGINCHLIQTSNIKLRYLETGFTGEVTFALGVHNSKLEKDNPELAAILKREKQNFCRIIAMLSDYAFYSGVGKMTAQGMGMVHRVR
jgi:CRISPR-associated endoribonuclease Cas6